MLNRNTKIVLLLFCFSFYNLKLKAQCNPDILECLGFGQLFVPYPAPSPCIEKNISYNSVLYFCYENPLLGNTQSVRFDSITGLPAGISYQFDKLDRTYSTDFKFNGYVSFNGITTDTVGKYSIRIYFSFPNSPDSIAFELFDYFNYLIRPYFEVIESGAVCNNIVQSVNEKQESLKVTAYPNPAQEKITFSSTNYFNNATINIYDVLGKNVITSTHITSKNIVINTIALQNGVYFYEIIDKQKRSQGRFYVNKRTSFLF